MKMKYKVFLIVSIIFVIIIALLIVFTPGNHNQTIVFTPGNYDQTIESAISKAILEENEDGYLHGETQTEGHKTLKVEKSSNNQIKVYCIVSYGEFGFENSIFTKISGSGAIPTIITLSENEFGEYNLLNYEEPEDGALYFESVQNMFPKQLYPYVFVSDKYYDDLLGQQEEYAKKYLISIGREDSVVTGDYVDKTLATEMGMDVSASNKLLSMFWDYPHWIGTTETIENNTRYVYRKDFDADRQIVTFTKTKEDGVIVEKYVIDTTGGDLTFLEGNPR